MPRVILCGCLRWNCAALAARVVGRLVARYGTDLVIVHGACPSGVDHYFDHAAEDRGVTVERHPAAWSEHGKAAGPIRNGEMISAGAEFVLAVHRDLGSSRGTKDMVRSALRAGLTVYLISSETAEPKRITELP